jgi:hypothetical protein
MAYILNNNGCITMTSGISNLSIVSSSSTGSRVGVYVSTNEAKASSFRSSAQRANQTQTTRPNTLSSELNSATNNKFGALTKSIFNKVSLSTSPLQLMKDLVNKAHTATHQLKRGVSEFINPTLRVVRQGTDNPLYGKISKETLEEASKLLPCIIKSNSKANDLLFTIVNHSLIQDIHKNRPIPNFEEENLRQGYIDYALENFASHVSPNCYTELKKDYNNVNFLAYAITDAYEQKNIDLPLMVAGCLKQPDTSNIQHGTSSPPALPSRTGSDSVSSQTLPLPRPTSYEEL